MVTVKCLHCGGDRLVRNGLTQNGKQRFLCSGCGRRSRENPQPNGYTEGERETTRRSSDGQSRSPSSIRFAANAISLWKRLLR